MNAYRCENSLKIAYQYEQFGIVCTDPPFSSENKRNPLEWTFTSDVGDALAQWSRLATRWVIVFTSSSGVGIDRIRRVVERPGFPLARVMPWCKPHTRSNRLPGPVGWQTTLALVFGKMGGQFKGPDHIVADAMQYRRQGTVGHPAQMPDSVGDWIARPFADRRLTMVDPFCGTGTLVRAFQRAGCRSTLGIDISPQAIASCQKLDKRASVI